MFATITLLICFSVVSSSNEIDTSTTIPADNPLIQIVGRNIRHGDGSSSFDAPGVSIRIGVEGATEVSVSLKVLHDRVINSTRNFTPNFFEVEVNGKRQPYRISTETSSNYTVAKYAIAHVWSGYKNYINFFKSTEAEWNAAIPQESYITITSVSIDSGRFIPPPPLAPRRIEFVGDSITAGFCNMCHTQTPGSKGVALESFYDSWASQICRRAKADCHTAAWSGYGVVRNYNPGPVTMPDIYKRTLLSVDGHLWKFSSWIPHAVVINLGTNDRVHCVDGFCTEFVTKYSSMIMATSRSYGSSVKWFLACGPISNLYCLQVREIVAFVRLQGVHAYFLDQTSFSGNNTCCGHPSIAGDNEIAAAGYTFIAGKLGW